MSPQIRVTLFGLVMAAAVFGLAFYMAPVR
jgi:hypothetical protein